jgi:hypothetical protein
MTDFRLAQSWSDPAHWRFGVLYRAPDDPRLFVPMRFTNAAWTPNVAHARAAWLGAVLFALAVGPFVIAAVLGRLGDNMISAASIVWFLVLYLPIGVFVRFAGDGPSDD